MGVNWWQGRRRISVVVDNESWILPYAERLLSDLSRAGDEVRLIRDYESLPDGDIAFLLGCVNLAPAEVLNRNRLSLVVHESDLPKGRGFAPVAWQILEGKSEIKVCLIEALPNLPDGGDIYHSDTLRFTGNELNPEIRHAQGEISIRLCAEFMAMPVLPVAVPQVGAVTKYARCRPADSRLDPTKSLSDQFQLLRVVDNRRYPAFFDHAGRRYILRIEAADNDSDAKRIDHSNE